MTAGADGAEADKALVLRDDVQIYYNGAGEVRLRKGVWNFEEAILTLDDLGPEHRDCLIALFAQLQAGDPVSTSDFALGQSLTQDERSNVVETLAALEANAYLSDSQDAGSGRFLAQLLGGTSDYSTYTHRSERPVLFFADSQSVADYAVTLAGEIDLPLIVMSQQEFKEIASLDLTTKFDAYATRRDLDRVAELLAPYSCVLGALERPHIVFLRNLNRALINSSTALSLGLLDGPFTTVFTIKPPETGCFECFEQRLLSRMEEMPSYRQFVSQAGALRSGVTSSRANPLMHSLAAQVLFEGLLIFEIGKAKLAGRVLNTYIPLTEIQVQPLLRVPFCPACGFVAEARMREMYTSSKKIIDRVVDRVSLIDD